LSTQLTLFSQLQEASENLNSITSDVFESFNGHSIQKFFSKARQSVLVGFEDAFQEMEQRRHAISESKPSLSNEI